MLHRREQSVVMTLKEVAEYLRVSKAHLSNVINGKVSGVPALRHARIGRPSATRVKNDEARRGGYPDELLEDKIYSSGKGKESCRIERKIPQFQQRIHTA
jgi:transcriptional regulator with XRE-family HTH domain